MAKEVYDKITIKLTGGKEIEVVPLNIRGLRKFSDTYDEYVEWMQEQVAKAREADGKPDTKKIQDKTFDTYLKLCVMSLEKILADDKDVAKYDSLAEFVEEEFDEKSMLTVLKYAGGLEAPNLPEGETQTQE